MLHPTHELEPPANPARFSEPEVPDAAAIRNSRFGETAALPCFEGFSAQLDFGSLWNSPIQYRRHGDICENDGGHGRVKRKV